jgi:hypothetical protein
MVSRMEPPRFLRSLLWSVFVLVVCAWALRWAYETVRPVVPLLVAGAVIAVVIRAFLWWRRWRFERW